MHPREHRVGGLAAPEENSSVMAIAELGEETVALQPVGDHDGTRLNPTDEGFVHLDRAGQMVPARWRRSSDDDSPDSSEPGHQRRARVLEDRAGGHRRLVPAAPAHPEPPPGAPRLGSLAGGTHESVGPPESREVVAARLLRGEAGFELLKRPRIVLHTPDYYLWGLLESREYPLSYLVACNRDSDSVGDGSCR